MIVHIVMFRLKEEDKKVSQIKIKAVLEELPKKIEELISMEVGINFDESERAFDLSLYATFKTKEDLKTYAIHPLSLIHI